MIVVLTGAGMSVESGLKTFRDADGLWENYPVQKVATHEGWLEDPTLVTNFYNMLRKKCWNVQPNEGHKLVAQLEKDYDVTVVTQNVDNLHEMAGSSKVIHLHGELMKVCSSRDVDDPRYQITLTPDNCEIEPGTKAGDGSLLRPYIVFFGEGVPYFEEARLVLICRKLYAQDLNADSVIDPAVFQCYGENDYHRMYINEIIRVLKR